MRVRSILIIGVLAMSLLSAQAATPSRLLLPSLIGDHMVLQRGTASVWGRDVPGQKVTVTLNGKVWTGKADSNGAFRVLLTGLKAGGPYEMEVQGSSSIKVKDVLVGDVWLGSGQSNMEFLTKDSRDAQKALAQAHDPKLRFFLQGRVMGDKALDHAQGTWQVCSPERVHSFSAVAYYFGRDLRRALDIPVGLIAASWGGSYIESWLPESALEGLPEAKDSLKKWGTMTPAQRLVWSKGVKPAMYLCGVRLLPKDPKQAPLTVLLAPEAGTHALGGTWGNDAKEGSVATYAVVKLTGPKPGPVGEFTGHFEGGAWANVSTKFKADGGPADLSGYKALEFSAKGDGEYFIFLPQPTVKDGCNWSSQPFKITDQWKTYQIDLSKLKQDNWGKPTPFTQDAIQALAFGVLLPSLDNIPMVLYNGMIHPLTKTRIAGVIWYQGESNEGRPGPYHKLLPALIRSWRKVWGEGDLPFLIAQLPDFKAMQKDPGQSNWAEIREAQAMAAQLPNVDYACLLGLGDAQDIHPKDKTNVGKRLALTALHDVYGQKVEFTGPRFESMTVEGAQARIHFKYAERGLKTINGKLRGFAIAGEDGKFVWAEARIEGQTVVVWNKAVKNPKAVRYAWADNPDANLYGKNGFPATPFRTDVAAAK